MAQTTDKNINNKQHTEIRLGPLKSIITEGKHSQQTELRIQRKDHKSKMVASKPQTKISLSKGSPCSAKLMKANETYEELLEREIKNFNINYHTTTYPLVQPPSPPIHGEHIEVQVEVHQSDCPFLGTYSSKLQNDTSSAHQKKLASDSQISTFQSFGDNDNKPDCITFHFNDQDPKTEINVWIQNKNTKNFSKLSTRAKYSPKQLNKLHQSVQ
ncbi:hypothetical protein J6590_002142 [Homalodisca vitripennis]|nr:hypothetical protein J6590_002142 [Homalodisca vitripennis]